MNKVKSQYKIVMLFGHISGSSSFLFLCALGLGGVGGSSFLGGGGSSRSIGGSKKNSGWRSWGRCRSRRRSNWGKRSDNPVQMKNKLEEKIRQD